MFCTVLPGRCSGECIALHVVALAFITRFVAASTDSCAFLRIVFHQHRSYVLLLLGKTTTARAAVSIYGSSRDRPTMNPQFSAWHGFVLIVPIETFACVQRRQITGLIESFHISTSTRLRQSLVDSIAFVARQTRKRPE